MLFSVYSVYIRSVCMAQCNIHTKFILNKRKVSYPTLNVITALCYTIKLCIYLRRMYVVDILLAFSLENA